MKKKVILLLTFALVLTNCGCRRVEPELRAYPLAMGFEWSADGYTVYYAMPNLAAYTGEGKEPEKRDLLWTYTGRDYAAIERAVKDTKEQLLDLGHVQVIILGEGLIQNKDAYGKTMEYLVGQPMLGSGSYVFASDMLAQVMAENGGMVDSLGEYLVDLLDKDPGEKPVILQGLYDAYYNREEIPELMRIEVSKEGLGIVK